MTGTLAVGSSAVLGVWFIFKKRVITIRLVLCPALGGRKSHVLAKSDHADPTMSSTTSAQPRALSALAAAKETALPLARQKVDAQKSQPHLAASECNAVLHPKGRATRHQSSIRLWPTRFLINMVAHPAENPALPLQKALACTRLHAMNLMEEARGESALAKEVTKWISMCSYANTPNEKS
ncbi:MAG: hypothetical protein WAO21_02045 [Verrucomicrobiia bacterium]